MNIPDYCIGCIRSGYSCLECDSCHKGSNYMKPATTRVLEVIRSVEFANAYAENDFSTIEDLIDDLCLADS